MANSRIRTLILGATLAMLGAVVWWWIMPAEIRAIDEQVIGFPDSDLAAHRARPWVLAAICLLPCLGTFVYLAGDTIDRYITRQFLSIFGICITALFMIWLLIDLGDNLSDFRDTPSPLGTAARFYATRTPAVVLLLLPYSLLLALLYSLGKLCTQREVIAVIQAGRSIVRMSLPLAIAGAFCTLFSMGLSYHWAPVAEGLQQAILAQAVGKEPAEASRVLYRNPDERRLWLIGSFPPDYQLGKPLIDVEVTTTRKDHSLASSLSAASAIWDESRQAWTFHDAVSGTYQPGEAPRFVKHEEPLVVEDWRETPWQLIKPGLSAAYLGIPELNTWLKAYARNPGFADPAPYRTQWHHRWALPFTCLVTVLLAAPLSIHFSRRGGGVFLAVVLSALMLLASNISLALGEAGILAPAFAAWLPNLLFTLVAVYLFHRRMTGQPIYQTLRRLFMADEP